MIQLWGCGDGAGERSKHVIHMHGQHQLKQHIQSVIQLWGCGDGAGERSKHLIHMNGQHQLKQHRVSNTPHFSFHSIGCIYIDAVLISLSCFNVFILIASYSEACSHVFAPKVKQIISTYRLMYASMFLNTLFKVFHYFNVYAQLVHMRACMCVCVHPRARVCDCG